MAAEAETLQTTTEVRCLPLMQAAVAQVQAEVQCTLTTAVQAIATCWLEPEACLAEAAVLANTAREVLQDWLEVVALAATPITEMFNHGKILMPAMV
ncbi:MAG: hypothetical protein CMJ39_00165 [Phycisphaerae bacterium]|nr:hypothetical protein [Phycisphaerae bacterium]